MASARWSKKKIFGVGSLVLLVVVLLYQWLVQFRRPESANLPPLVVATGTYADLTAGQRRLLDDFISRLNTATGNRATAAAIFDDLALSTRTTFTAVTHALSQTPLSDKSGQSMKLTALDLVARLDAVAGSVPDAGGDRQFRMYVQLRPDTRKTLEASREFSRQVDNTVYHKGFPICFRGAGGTPSIQFSLSPDGTRGDIDVDYRSSAFPLMLINGHLTASNSDVRAGNNGDRHNGHWAGLAAWWRGFMGLPAFESPRAEAADVARSVSSTPRLATGTKPEEAIHDFLSAWLVEQKPGIAVGYVADRALACLEAEGGVPVDRGVARFQIVRKMQSVGAMIGTPGRLADAIRGVTLTGPRARVMRQPYNDQFVMYEVRDDLAASLDCENRLHPDQVDPEKAKSREFGKYVGAVFQLTSRIVKGETVALIWAEDKSGWRLVAYDVEPEVKPAPIPNAVDTGPVPPPTSDPGVPEMTRAVHEFLDAWFVRRDAAAAFGFLAPTTYACYNVYRPESLPEAGSDAEAGRLIQERMKTLSDWTGRASRLEDVLVGVEPHNPDYRRVTHKSAAAFSIVAVPDAVGESVDCGRLTPGQTPVLPGAGTLVYGRYYAASIRLKRAGPDAAVLWTLWSKTGAVWKVVSYLVITP